MEPLARADVPATGTAPARRATLRERLEPQLPIAALLLFVGAWGVWAILVDRQPPFSDSVLPDTLALLRALGSGSFSEWLRGTTYRPPLSYIPAGFLFAIGGQSLALLELTVLAQHLAAIVVVYDSGRLLGGRTAGLLAATLAATFPIVFGWGRMPYADTSLALFVLLTMRLALTVDLARWRSAVGLGVTVGLGMLTKVAFPVFAVVPLLWVAVTRIRSRRQLAGAAIAAASAIVTAGWWVLPQLKIVLLNIQMSTRTAGSEPASTLILRRLFAYTVGVDGGIWMLALALAGSIAAWVLRAVPRRPLLLYNVALWSSFAAFVLVFDEWRRYLVPTYALAALVAGATGAAVLRRWSAAGRLGVRLLAAVVLVYFVLLNLGHPVRLPRGPAHSVGGERLDAMGLLSPDRGDYSPYPQALVEIEKHCGALLLVASSAVAHERQMSQDEILRLHRGGPHIYHHPQDHPPESACVLMVNGTADQGRWSEEIQREVGHHRLCLTYVWFAATRARRRVGTWGPSPIGLSYSLYLVDKREFEPPYPQTSPICRLQRDFWDRRIGPSAGIE
jgi:hypothetical protein